MQPDALTERFTELQTQSQRTLTAFLKEEISLGLTFVAMASTEKDLGNTEHSQRAKEHARRAVVTVRHFLDSIEDATIRSTIAQQCAELEKTVESE